MIRYYLDTEFVETGDTIDLISIGIVCEDGRELYCEVDGFDWSRANQWVLDNVKPHLWSSTKDKTEFNAWSRDGGVGGLHTRKEIARLVREFCDPEVHGKPEFWTYYGSYDWVVTCWLFGSMMDLPTGWPMFTMDLKQLAQHSGNPQLPVQAEGEHHALLDARHNRVMWEFLRDRARGA